MSYTSQFTNSTVTARLTDLDTFRTALSKSPAPYAQKVRALRTVAWPKEAFMPFPVHRLVVPSGIRPEAELLELSLAASLDLSKDPLILKKSPYWPLFGTFVHLPMSTTDASLWNGQIPALVFQKYGSGFSRKLASWWTARSHLLLKQICAGYHPRCCMSTIPVDIWMCGAVEDRHAVGRTSHRTLLGCRTFSA